MVICPAVAARNATEHGVADDDEMALLVVHGLLHLLGMDHEDEAEAERMEQPSATLLARYNRARGGPRRGRAVIAADGFRAVDWLLIAVILILLAVSAAAGPGRDEPGPHQPGEGHGRCATTADGGPANWCAWSSTPSSS